MSSPSKTPTSRLTRAYGFLVVVPGTYAYFTDNSCLGFEVLTPVVMKSSTFRDITPYSPLTITGLYVPGDRAFQTEFLLRMLDTPHWNLSCVTIHLDCGLPWFSSFHLKKIGHNLFLPRLYKLIVLSFLIRGFLT